MRQLQFIRSLKVSQSSVATSSDIINAIAKPETVGNAEELAHYKSLNRAEFQALGNPPSIMSINSPPSVPIYVRKGSLLAVYGVGSSPVNSISSTLELLNPIKRFIFGGYSTSYQRIISTSPFSLLVSSKHRGFRFRTDDENKSFATLLLDGSSDWALLGRDSLQVFTGNALNINMYRIPKKVSKKLANSLQVPSDTLTGLRRWNKSGYTLVSGRGQVGIVGCGSLYNINLSASEEVLVNKNNLLAVSVNGPYDLQNCVARYSFSPIDNKLETPSPSEKTTKTIINRFRFNSAGLNKYLGVLTDFFKNLMNFTKTVKNNSFNTYLGNQDFVKVVGPRNILLLSSTPSYTMKGYVEPTERLIQQKTGVNEIERKSADYLNTVTIQPGKGAVFESTPDFHESVKKFERKS